MINRRIEKNYIFQYRTIFDIWGFFIILYSNKNITLKSIVVVIPGENFSEFLGAHIQPGVLTQSIF